MRRVLVLNAGSSTLKASVLDADAVEPLAQSTLPWAADEERTLRQALDRLGAEGSSFEAVGHRVVHGGTRFVQPTRVDEQVIEAIESLARFAPLHNPLAARTLHAARRALPNVPHVVCFDTAFHATLDPAAFVYALPYEWFDKWGYRRFGFHGLSVTWVRERAGELLDRNSDDLGVVVAHLGAGCSVTAVWRGASVSTSMGMTPLEGVVMATRAGSIDPGIIVAAMREHRIGVEDLERALDHESGLLGISGQSADMRELLARESADARTALAIEIFVRSVAAGIAAAATALPRLDAVAFTGGIGENASSVRARICARLGPLGVAPVPDRAVDTDGVLVREPVAVRRVAAREDVVIARQTRALLG